MTAALQLEGVSKRYWKLRDQPSLIGALTGAGRERRSELWALRDVDLTVEAGETIGIIGRNGSGKTTLLKILAGVTQPTLGRVSISGRVAPLIGIGVGFRGELSGRDNVALNATLLGLDRSAIRERFDQIVEFSELASFIDTPVKFYSSGMFLRLAFAIAIHANPSILLVDEILAVGDLAFQGKCLRRIRELKRSGTTIVLVSHAMQAITAMSSRVLLLRRGDVEYLGDPEAAVGRYHELISEDAGSDPNDMIVRGEQMFLGGATILNSSLVGQDGQVGVAHRDVPLTLQLNVRFDRPVEHPLVHVAVSSEDGTIVYSKHSPLHHRYRSYEASQSANILVTFLPRLAGGTYRVTSAVVSSDGRGILVSDAAGVLFYVSEKIGEYGLADLEGEITVDGIVLDVPKTWRGWASVEEDAEIDDYLTNSPG